MPTKRVPLRRGARWQITPTAVKLWALFLEISAQPRNAHGELCDEDAAAERDVMAELARAVGFSKFDVGIQLTAGIGDEPPAYFRNNPVQLEAWCSAREIKTTLDRALLQRAALTRSAAAQRRKPRRNSISAADGAPPEHDFEPKLL
jgi:hypothetical protein